MDVKQILNELKNERNRLDKAISAIEAIGPTGGVNQGAAATRPGGNVSQMQKPQKGRRQLSAAARRRISEAQKRRWAQQKRAA